MRKRTEIVPISISFFNDTDFSSKHICHNKYIENKIDITSNIPFIHERSFTS